MSDPRRASRRHFLAATVGACAVVPAISASAQIGTSGLGSLTKAERDRLAPGQVLDALRQGNERFRTGKMASRDYRDQQRTSAAGQFPRRWSWDVSTRARRPRSFSTRALATRSMRGSPATS